MYKAVGMYVPLQDIGKRTRVRSAQAPAKRRKLSEKLLSDVEKR